MVMFKKQPIIQFINTIPGLENYEDLLPKPAKNYLPKWWFDAPSITKSNKGGIRKCPGIYDILTHGYILPMWVDMEININEQGISQIMVKRDLSFNFAELSFFPHAQFLDYVDYKIMDRKVEASLAFQNPWKVITPKGYSVLQLPLFYNESKEYTVMPGIMETDVFHFTNIPVLAHSNGETIKLKAGDPFCLYIPFKREKTKHLIKNASEKFLNFLQDQSLDFEEIRETKKINPYTMLTKDGKLDI